MTPVDIHRQMLSTWRCTDHDVACTLCTQHVKGAQGHFCKALGNLEGSASQGACAGMHLEFT